MRFVYGAIGTIFGIALSEATGLIATAIYYHVGIGYLGAVGFEDGGISFLAGIEGN